MHRILLIECAARGLLYINGQFCGPLEGDGQAFPTGRNTEIYIQFFPFSAGVLPLTVDRMVALPGFTDSGLPTGRG